MKVIVINREQQQFVEPMRNALAPVEPLFVFDRCAPVKGVNAIVNRGGVGFLAGRMRDLGADGMDDDILFLDGDKVPLGNIVSDIADLQKFYGAICYGVAPEYESSVYREFMHKDGVHGIVPWQAEGRTPIAFGCYTCGMWLSREAVRSIRKLNGGRIFHPAFDGRWGDEDNFLADELDWLGFRIGYSTRVRLSGKFGDIGKDKMELYVQNFMRRLELNKGLLHKKV